MEIISFEDKVKEIKDKKLKENIEESKIDLNDTLEYVKCIKEKIESSPILNQF